jgi:NitT/TauT family transport system substrate-binding protein
MKSRKIRTVLLTLAILLISAAIVFGGGKKEETPAPLIPRLVLVGPPGPMAIPLVYIVKNDKLADIAEETKFLMWRNPDQLRAIIGGGEEGHFLTMPSNSAAMFYNKGIGLNLLDISVWGILYVISTDPQVKTIADLKGKEVVVPFKGNMPDLIFNYLCRKNNIDTLKDITIYYANTPQQAAQLMLSGKKNCALLTEPMATQVLMKAKKAGMNIHRSIDIQAEWGKATGLGERIPIAGTAALPSIKDNNRAIRRFMEEYMQAVEWQKKNPEQAGILGSEIEGLGFEAKPVAESIKNTKWDFTQVKDCREEIEEFFKTLMDLNPKVIGGKLPDSGFYYEGSDLE